MPDRRSSSPARASCHRAACTVARRAASLAAEIRYGGARGCLRERTLAQAPKTLLMRIRGCAPAS
eukprot:5844850-Prymnesium_polylepis.1